MRCLACAILSLLAVSATFAGEVTVPRFLEFRDGSLLRLDVLDEFWPVTLVRSTGRIENTTIRSASLQTLQLTREEDFAHKRSLLALVQQLGSSSFRDREKAWATLRARGTAIRADLEGCLHLTSDTEIKVRLLDLLRRLPAGEPGKSVTISFDRLHLTDKDTLWGYLGATGITVVIDGKKYKLGRKEVVGMTTQAPPLRGLAGNLGFEGGFRRIGINEFPPGCIEEGFEQTPTGRPLRIGENIEKLFINKGFVLSTSITTSFVSVNNYVVSGKSRGLSAATHQPLWNGEVTIRFIQPGNENVPAGVTHFGVFIAAVMPRGTALHAFDLQGRELGVIHTEQNGTDFLGVRSPIPIHKIRIVPDVTIDRDYTLDDLIYTPPQLPEASHPERFTAVLAAGDVVLCKDVVLVGDRIQLLGLPGGLPDRTLRRDEVLRLNSPHKRGTDPFLKNPTGLFAELKDGSILYAPEPANKRAMPVFPRWPDLLKQPAPLVGLWHASYPRLPHYPPSERAGLWDPDLRQWRTVQQVRLLEEGVQWKNPDGEFASCAYPKLPPLWLASPSIPEPAHPWRVRTSTGEDLVLRSDQPLHGRMSKEITLLWQGQTIRLTPAEIVSLYQRRE